MTPGHADRTWMTDAACRGADTSIFYDDSRREEAQAICALCPVRRDCGNHAERTREQFGVWGGDTSRLRNTHRHPERHPQNRTGPTVTQRILQELHAAGTWLTPAALAERTGTQHNTTQKALRRALDANLIEHTDGGWYRATQVPVEVEA